MRSLGGSDRNSTQPRHRPLDSTEAPGLVRTEQREKDERRERRETAREEGDRGGAIRGAQDSERAGFPRGSVKVTS